MAESKSVGERPKLTTGEVRLSHCYIWEPIAFEEGADPKYKVQILIPKSDEATIKKIEAGIETLKKQIRDKNNGKLSTKFWNPLRDGDTDNDKDYPEMYGHYYLTAKSDHQPGIVSTEKDKDGKWKPITDKTQVYSGCYGRVSISLFPYTEKGQGVGVVLYNVQKLRDGEPLGGGKSDPNDDFEDDITIDDDEEI
jgi:hypothetical protein